MEARVIRPLNLPGSPEIGTAGPLGLDAVTFTTETTDIHDYTDDQIFEPLRRNIAAPCTPVIVAVLTFLVTLAILFKVFRATYLPNGSVIDNRYKIVAYAVAITIGVLLAIMGVGLLTALCGCDPCSPYNSIWFNLLFSLVYAAIIYAILNTVITAILGINFTFLP